MKMQQELSTSGIESGPEKTLQFLQGEVKYLAEEVRRLEVENFELRQEIALLELLIQDLQIGTPKGEMN